MIEGRLAVAFILFAAPSCGGKVSVDVPTLESTEAPACATVCPKIAEACPDKDPDCVGLCAAIEKLRDPCSDPLDGYLSCLDENPDYTCNTSAPACQAEEKAFFVCANAYCEMNPEVCTPWP